MRGFRQIAILFVVSVALYAIPTLAEIVLLKFHVSAWISCVLLADLPGAFILYRMGFRKVAIGVYAGATLIEMAMLLNGMTANRLVWFTNLAPAATVCLVLMLSSALDSWFQEER